jgi:hypothetical protein
MASACSLPSAYTATGAPSGSSTGMAPPLEVMPGHMMLAPAGSRQRGREKQQWGREERSMAIPLSQARPVDKYRQSRPLAQPWRGTAVI